MNLSSLLTLVKEAPYYRKLLKELSQGGKELNLAIAEAAKPYLIAALYQEVLSPTLVISTEPKDAKRLYDELQVWCPISTPIYLFPEPDTLPYEELSPDIVTLSGRLETVAALNSQRTTASNNPRLPLIIASAPAIMSKTISPVDFTTISHTLTTGMSIDLMELLAKWEAMGYEMEEVVEMPGAVSRRGGIIDIFPPGNELPARIEFFGNQIETIRLFDPQTQRSVKTIPSITLIPARESLGDQPELAPTNTTCLLDHLPKEAFVIIDSPEDVRAIVEEMDSKAKELRETRIERDELSPSYPIPYLSWAQLRQKIKDFQKCFNFWSWGDDETSEDFEHSLLPFTSAPSYGGKLDLFIKDLKTKLVKKERTVIISHQASRLRELMQEKDILVPIVTEIVEVPPGSIALLQGSLSSGFILKDIINLFSDAELFGFFKQRRLTKKRPVRRQWFLYQLSPGDYVVHIEHGIGKFLQLASITLENVTREYLVIEYAASDRLYVPTDQIDRVSRYIGATDQPPALSRLGTQEWARTKQRIKEAVANIAQELLNLYATREIVEGFAFSPDSIWQQELEASFPYMETPDQLETISAVKEDMERVKPMDRLVCGDVGYGKTEVALRTAFKAVMDSKQVALLVPTTVLAQQHFNTFKERLQAFPIRVEMLSRFCSEKEQEIILEGIANGTVDICIGTHRLLQKDVIFKNLGLVIIDEEQRFGVVHKEKLKQLRQEVDVLTLSATPIPRTLHMSLVGIKDMSIMETPPEERLPIKTYVGPYDDRLIRDAILRELERNGQVFFVHNRVQNIRAVANKLQELVTEARIAIAHGQMPEDELEEVMVDFVDGRKDVLVSTIIIESGLDMPNVNTLIVNQADRLGLSQLYQLRGRVGRGTERAYAYFLFDKDKRLTPQAQKRLRTIFEATELGAGFGIAMKDLEIRGAGNLLGVEQSGHIAAVGFDLYCRLLAESVDELRSKQTGKIEDRRTEFLPPTITLPLPAYIPEEYIPSPATRIAIYHRLTKIGHTQEIDDIAQELKDRFGPLSRPVKNLFEMLEIKLLATDKGVESVTAEAKQITINLASGKRLHSLPLASGRDKVRIGTGYISLDMRRLGDRWLKALKKLLEDMVVT